MSFSINQPVFKEHPIASVICLDKLLSCVIMICDAANEEERYNLFKKTQNDMNELIEKLNTYSSGH